MGLLESSVSSAVEHLLMGASWSSATLREMRHCPSKEISTNVDISVITMV